MLARWERVGMAQAGVNITVSKAHITRYERGEHVNIGYPSLARRDNRAEGLLVCRTISSTISCKMGKH